MNTADTELAKAYDAVETAREAMDGVHVTTPEGRARLLAYREAHAKLACVLKLWRETRRVLVSEIAA